jgi:hypothetical protein
MSAMTAVRMKQIIRYNGHLELDGTENRAELAEALHYLCEHTYSKCQRPQMGEPIDSFLMEIKALITPSKPRRKISNIDMRGHAV